MNCRIREIRTRDIVLVDEDGQPFTMLVKWLERYKVNIERLKVGGIIRIDNISYGCCKLFVKYDATFSSFNNEISFCPFCGAKL